MNRIFHARIAWYQYSLLMVLTIGAVSALWCEYILPAVLLMLLLIVVIGQIIHTVYIVSTDELLEISTERFIRKKVIPIAEITAIRKYHSIRFEKLSVTNHVLTECGNGEFASVTPVEGREFVELIKKRMGL